MKQTLASLPVAPVVAAAVVVIALSNHIHCHQSAAAAAPVEPYQQPSYHQHHHSFDPYSYGYDVEDNYGNKQWRQERSSNPHEVHGSYGYRDKNGIYREVSYVADKNGFRANIRSNEPGVSATREPASVKLDTPSASSASYYSPVPSGVPVYTKHVAVPTYYSSSQQ